MYQAAVSARYPAAMYFREPSRFRTVLPLLERRIEPALPMKAPAALGGMRPWIISPFIVHHFPSLLCLFLPASSSAILSFESAMIAPVRGFQAGHARGLALLDLLACLLAYLPGY